jgi:hypothetical protein
LALGVALGVAQDEPAAPPPPPAEKSPYNQAAKGVSLETSETLFTVLSALNYCGYNADLEASDALRAQIRGEISQVVEGSPGLSDAAKTMCQFYTEHQQADTSRDLAQYISLGLFLDPPPSLAPRVKESDIPPDAVSVIGFVPMLQNFYKQANLHSIWEKHHLEYERLVEGYHPALARMAFETEMYLKLPSAGYLGRGFTVFLEPMGAPGQVNARNYGPDYFVVVSPGNGTSLKMDEIHHTYLHYLLDPQAMKYPEALKRLEPLLNAIARAPLEDNFKKDPSLLVTECFIRAVEARTRGDKRTPETQRQLAVQQSQEQGYVLTSYFYLSLPAFEKDPAGLRNLFGDLLQKIDVGAEVKRAQQIKFAAKADSDVLHLSRSKANPVLTAAEQKLSAGDSDGAGKLAQAVLDEKNGADEGRALFILAEVATRHGDIEGARAYFLRALGATQEPKVVAWSHIYLGRIFDLQEEREAAVTHYKAALSASGTLPDAKTAAERGIEKAYEPPSRPQAPAEKE